MASDLKALLARYPKGTTVETGSLPAGGPLPLFRGSWFCRRRFAYIDEPKMVAILVLNSKE